MIELIAVMVIVAILGTFAIPQLLDLRDDAKNAVRVTDAGDMAARLQRLSMENQLMHTDKPTTGVPIRHCEDGAGLARLLDPSQNIIKGALGNLYYYNASATYGQDPGWVYNLGGGTTILTTGETRSCTVQRGSIGSPVTFTITGCYDLDCSGP